MDLSLLPHLSDSALREEAARRNLDVADLDRDAIIAAIRDAETRVDVHAVTEPPAPPPIDPLAATLPPERPRPDPRAPTAPRERPSGAFGAARALLGRVVSMARTALDGPDEPPRPPPEPPRSSEPIPTRTMAELLIRQGHLERACSILRELSGHGDEDVATLLADVEGRLADDALRRRAASRLKTPGRPFVELVDVPHGRGVVWRVDETGLARGRALLGAPGALTLRVVQIVAHPDHSVESRREDRGSLDASGWTRLDAPPGARLVVSLGLSEGERFVSILHGTG